MRTEMILLPDFGPNLTPKQEQQKLLIKSVGFVADHLLTCAVQPQIYPFLEGFNELISSGSLKGQH